MEAELEKLEYNLGGVRDMKRLPQAVVHHRPEDRGDRAARGRAPARSRSSPWSTPTSTRPGRLPDPRQRRRDPLLRAGGLDDRRGGRGRRPTELRARPRQQAPRRGGGAQAPRRRRSASARPRRRAAEAEARPRRPPRRRQQAQAAEARRSGRRAAARPQRRRPPQPAPPAPEPAPARDGGSMMAEVTAADVKALRERTGAGDDGLQGRARRGRRRHRQGGRDPARQGPGLGREARRPRRPARASSPPTSTPTARSASWSRSSARPTSSPATTTSRSSPARSRCTSPARRPRSTSRPRRSPRRRARPSAASTSRRRARRASPTTWSSKIVEGQLDEVGQGGRPARAGARQLRPLRGQDDRAAARRARREDRREHPHRPLRPLRRRRGVAARLAAMAEPVFKRVLLKLSGEALMGSLEYGTDPERVERDRAPDPRGLRARRRDRRSWSAPATSTAASRARPRAWTARPPTTWGCWRRSSTR